MTMNLKVLTADYGANPPEILASLCCDQLAEITDRVTFASETKNGAWKLHDFGRGTPPPSGGPFKTLVSLIETGPCDNLQEGDELKPRIG